MERDTLDPMRGTELPGRTIPVPTSVSGEAQAALAVQLPTSQPFPPIENSTAWQVHVSQFDQWYALAGAQMAAPRAKVESTRIAGVQVAHAIPEEWRFPVGKVVLDIHGGAMIYSGGEQVIHTAAHIASRMGAELFSIDYRMPPHAPYPAGLDDCMAVYAAAVERYGSGNIVVRGLSAGGNLAAALTLRARDEGLPMPKALILLTPQADLTESGDTFQTLAGIDRLSSLMPVNLLYANGHALDDPYLSPLFGDFAKGFPPTFLQSGTRDLFLSNTVRMHRRLRRAGVEAELHIWEAMPHGGFNPFGFVPEDAELEEEIGRFVKRHWDAV